MRKLKFYVPVLAIVLTGLVCSTTSCVDDSESQSVTDLRGARAEQMKAEAELAKAQGEAEKIRANAEAALMAAQAKAAEADAKYKEAQAAHQAAVTQIEKDKAAIELQKAEAELNQAKADADLAIERAKSQLELLKLQAQIDKRRLQDELDKLETNDPVLAEAIAKYSNFIGEVNNLTMSIAGDKLDLAKLEALKADKTASAEERATSLIKTKNDAIKGYNKSIDQNNIQIANWTTLLSKGTANAEEEIAKLQAQYDALYYNKSVDLRKAYEAATDAKNEAKQAVVDFRDLGTVRSPYIGGYVGSYGEIYNVDYYTVADLNINITNYKKSLASSEEALAELEEEYAEAEQDQQELYDDMEAKDRVQSDKWTNYVAVNNNPASTAAEIQAAWDAYETARTNFNNAANAYNTAKNIVDTYPAMILSQKSYIADYKEYIAELETALAAYATDSETPRSLEDAYVAAYKAMIEAEDAYYEVHDEMYAIESMIDDIKYIQYAYGSTISLEEIQTYIENLENANVNLTNYIAQANRDINEIKEDKTIAIAKLDLDIQDLKAKIAADEEELAVAKQQADAAKAVITARTK